MEAALPRAVFGAWIRFGDPEFYLVEINPKRLALPACEGSMVKSWREGPPRISKRSDWKQ
ncbi:MAG: hypothetical protein ACI9OJ_002661 [Myxococcota bacterium]